MEEMRLERRRAEEMRLEWRRAEESKESGGDGIGVEESRRDETGA